MNAKLTKLGQHFESIGDSFFNVYISFASKLAGQKKNVNKNFKINDKAKKYGYIAIHALFIKWRTFGSTSPSSNISARWIMCKSLILCTVLIMFLYGYLMLCSSVGKTRIPTSAAFDYGHIDSTVLSAHSYVINRKVSDHEESDILDSIMGSETFNIDYVTPAKINNFLPEFKNSLNRPEMSFSSNEYSPTGNFRTKSNQVWDPHPEYIMTVFGHQLHLKLQQDFSLENPTVISITSNQSKVEDENYHNVKCFYKGFVQGDESSTVSLSLCDGMTGHIQTSAGSLLIQPIESQRNTKDLIVHKIWRQSKQNDKFRLPDMLKKRRNNVNDRMVSKLVRRKRNYVDKHLFTMEVLVAVDKTMSDFHNADLKSYILTLISIVSNIFSDASIGNSIHISVPNILILRDDIVTSQSKKSISASQLLKHFCSFLKKKSIHYDTAIMLTRDQICRNERETKCDTLGLAELGTVCKRYSCSIVQDNGLPAAFTIAHELGHILNMPHDDDTRCVNFQDSAKNRLHIMSSTMGDDIHPWSWSDCSRHYVSEFLEKEDTTCLEDTAQITVPNSNKKLPGELYSLDEQCKLIHGNHSKYCFIEGECTRLWCKAEKHLSDCKSSNLPWADGSPCKNKKYWCQRGKCTPREAIKLNAINGGWGPWSSFTPCSMTCGGGIQESQRECNRPLPANGGKYCGGSRKKYRSCNTQSCPPGSLDSREQQCYDMNGNNFGLKGISSSVRWIPKYGLIGKDKCKLYCRLDTTNAYFQLGDKVKDGTTCSFDSFDKCVNGICRPAGCDNELNSIATLDKCGVCEGRNNTCEEYSGNFYRSDLSNKTNSLYYYVTTIPKGSSNIVITQPGYHTQNYIVLRTPDGTSLLNGDRVINTYRHVFFYAGVSFEYNGSTSMLERVNTTYSRKLKKDLVVEVISLNLDSIRNDSVLLSYTYTVDKPNLDEHVSLHQWELKDWSQCDALCQGTSFQLVACINTDTGHKVPPPFCDSSEKPSLKYRSCNVDCFLTLNVTGISECSATCGSNGKRKKNYQCIKTDINTGVSNVVDLSYCEPKFEINVFEECREGCWKYTDWTLCSQTCGNGQQTRGLACYLNGTKVDNSLCSVKTEFRQTENVRSCNLRPCADWSNYAENNNTLMDNWVTQEWGVCNDNCEKSRTVSCNPGYKCSNEKKPIEKKKCCVIKYIAAWSPCSIECGVGTRKKEFYCARVFKSERKTQHKSRLQINSRYCSKLRLPTPKRSKKSCKVSCRWIAGNWSTCLSDCRTEFQVRSVSCANISNRQISSKYCELNKKPLTKRMCSHCIRREFKVTKCNCEGYRRRREICSDPYGKRIQCPNKQKILKEKCRSPDECLPNSCSDIKRYNKQSLDREYTIFIKQKSVKLYCHNMAREPKEYVTLNPSENYSIFYNNKTRYPDVCPPESRDFEYRDTNVRYGRTHFRKIAINISTLRVIENDFTFTETVGTPQSFGSAGDCYNRNGECPQGDFSINFNSTGFLIRPGTKWTLSGNSARMKFSNKNEGSSLEQRAFCGGYCGRCEISPNEGLFLDVY